MAQRDLVHGIPSIKHTTQVCDVCLIGKHSRAPFPKKAKARSTSPLDLVYGDLCGPITPPTPSGKKYIFLGTTTTLTKVVNRSTKLELLRLRSMDAKEERLFEPNISMVVNVNDVFVGTKKDANGKNIKHKARLVAKGYIQQHGIDFEEVFAPVARMETIRLLLAIAANNKWEVHHLDVKSAFLHGDLKEEVYVTQPKGFVKRLDNGKVYRLIKALYGLRQAPQQAIYTKTSKDSTLLIGVYVDDLIITGTPKKEIDKFKAQMEEKFKMSDLGLLAYYLGIEVTQTEGITYSITEETSIWIQRTVATESTAQEKGNYGIIFFYGESQSAGVHKKQATVALIIHVKSEIQAATAAATQALWLKRLLSKLTYSQEEKVTIQVDNKSAITLMKNPVFHGRSKHIDTKYHFIRECVEREDIQVEFVSGEYQKADILTKALPKIKFLTMRQLIGLKDLTSQRYALKLRWLMKPHKHMLLSSVRYVGMITDVDCSAMVVKLGYTDPRVILDPI
ncbi:ribonuclease H-like domain, reverse transcriptase, RNA-dependent DNA polymerase [Tanacetum coccineum]